MNNIKAHTGSALRGLRTARSVSQREVAQAAGLTQAAVSLWERGDTSPRVDQLVAVLDALGSNLEEFGRELQAHRRLDMEDMKDGGSHPEGAAP